MTKDERRVGRVNLMERALYWSYFFLFCFPFYCRQIKRTKLWRGRGCPVPRHAFVSTPDSLLQKFRLWWRWKEHWIEYEIETLIKSGHIFSNCNWMVYCTICLRCYQGQDKENCHSIMKSVVWQIKNVLCVYHKHFEIPLLTILYFTWVKKHMLNFVQAIITAHTPKKGKRKPQDIWEIQSIYKCISLPTLIETFF